MPEDVAQHGWRTRTGTGTAEKGRGANIGQGLLVQAYRDYRRITGLQPLALLHFTGKMTVRRGPSLTGLTCFPHKV